MSRKKRRNQKSGGLAPAGTPASPPSVPLTPFLGQSAGSASPQPKVEVQTPGAVTTATAPEHQPAKDEPSRSGRWLPAPLAVLDADYSQVLRMRNVRYLIVISAVVGALVFGWYLSSIFVPLLIALALAYMLNPLVEALERRGVSRMRAVILIFLAVVAASTAAGIWFVASLVKDVRSIIEETDAVLSEFEGKQDEWVGQWNENAPPWLNVDPEELTVRKLQEWVKDMVTPPRAETSPAERQAASAQASAKASLLSTFQHLDKDASLTLDPGELKASAIKELDKNHDGTVSPEEYFARFGAGALSDSGQRVVASGAQDAAKGVFSAVSEGLFTVLYFAVMTILIPIYTWFFLLGLPGIVNAVDHYLPAAQRPRIRRLLSQIDSMAKGFFRGRLIVIFIITVLTTILFVALGVRYAFVLGLLAGVGIMIPLFSFIFSMIPAILLMAIAPEPSVGAIITMVVLFSAIQAFEQYYLTPKLLGDAVELHPVTLLVGVFVMSSLFGLFGALLAVPLTALAKTLGREFLLPYFKSLAEEQSPESRHTRVIART